MFVHGCAATPHLLLNSLVNFGKASKLHEVELIHIHTEGDAIYTKPEYDGEYCPNFFYLFTFFSMYV